MQVHCVSIKEVIDEALLDICTNQQILRYRYYRTIHEVGFQGKGGLIGREASIGFGYDDWSV